MKTNIFTHIALGSFVASALFFSGCRKEMLPELTDKATTSEAQQSEEDIPWIPGTAFVKLSEASLRAIPDFSATLRSSSLRAASGSVKMERVIEPGGPYEAAHRRAGLDRWYKLTFDPKADVNAVLRDLKADPAVEFSHGEIKIVPEQVTYVPITTTRAPRLDLFPDFNNGYGKFDDPLLKKQWHYQNDGLYQGFSEGADISLFNAWEKETGKKDVIVAVIDAGVDVSHPDLEKAMWSDPKNPAVHGWNFFNDNADIAAGAHGTHVAGTIAARNNNGEGISGIAGGDGSPDSGVRIMSCQIFSNDNTKSAGEAGILRAFTFAADNGAVVANCSWGYEYERGKQYYSAMPKMVQDGIDYFINNAGVDPNTKEKRADAPMKGGVVFFGAGNSRYEMEQDREYNLNILPASYDKVIAVGAFVPDYSLSSYSNTGPWVDIMAPGGSVENQNFEGILSTVPADFKDYVLSEQPRRILGAEFLFPGTERYAYMQGTSMATPHVTGIAALIVSKFGGKDKNFTSEDLKKRLLSSIKSVDMSKATTDKHYVGNVGAGYIDAAIALGAEETKAPAQVTGIKAAPDYYSAKLTWAVTGDEDALDQKAFEYQVYLSKDKLTDKNLPAEALKGTYRVGMKKVGDEMTVEIKSLEASTKYYVTLVGLDRYGNKSFAHSEFSTLVNASPVFSNLPSDPITILNSTPFYRFVTKISDPDGQKWTFAHGDLPEGVTVAIKGDEVTVTIIPVAKPGEYAFELTAEDALGGVTTKKIVYLIAAYESPKRTALVNNLTFSVGDKPAEIGVSDLFETVPGLKAKYSALSSDPTVADVSVTEDNKVVVTPKGKGIATVTVTVNDGVKSARSTFDVTVTDATTGVIRALYPSPAHTFFKAVTTTKASEIEVTLTSLRGETVLKGKYPVDPANSSITVDIARLAPGVYHLTLDADGKVERRTIVKN